MQVRKRGDWTLKVPASRPIKTAGRISLPTRDLLRIWTCSYCPITSSATAMHGVCDVISSARFVIAEADTGWKDALGSSGRGSGWFTSFFSEHSAMDE